MPSLSRRDALRTIGLAGVASVAGCSSLPLGNGPNEHPPDTLGTSWSPSTDAWRFKYADLQNTARSPHEIQTPPTIKWQNRITDTSSASLISGELVAATPDQVITVGRSDSELHLRAYGAIDGKRRWNRRIQYQSGRRVPRFGGLVNGSLYITDGGTDVIAVNARDGTIRWRRDLYDRVADAVPEKFLSPSNSAVDFSPIPVATPETVYIQSSYGLHGIDPGDGSERWRLYLGDQIDEAALEDPYGLAVTPRRVWASYGGHVQALFTVRLSDGSREVERTHLPFEFPSHPVVTDDREAVLTHDIVWGTSPLETLAVGVAGEDVEWQFPGYAGEGAAAYSPVATDGDHVFVAASYEQQEQLVVFALQVATGKLEWLYRESLADRNVSVGAGGEFRLCQPAVTGGTLVVGYGTNPEQGTGHGEVVALSRAAGQVQWRSTLSIAPQDVMRTGNRLYVGGQQGTVVALTDNDSD
nr:PQQ-binding-like beta-propeller repeat protein [Halarchaeum solikamskense]